LVVADRALFISVAGQSLPYNTVRNVFLQLIGPSSGMRTQGVTRASTIFATPSRFDHWSSAATIALRSPATSWRSAPTSATRT
jgi:hypothetical protein